MTKLLDGTRHSTFSILYFCTVIIFAASASMFVRLYGNIHQMTYGSVFLLLFTILFIVYNRVKFTKRFFLSVIVLLMYSLITSLQNGVVNFIWIYKWLLALVIAFSICSVFEKKIFVTYETIIYRLSIISLVFWLFHILFPSQILSLFKVISLVPFSLDKETLNIIFYSVNNFDTEDIFSFTIRNAGFAWEPGAFSCFLILAIFCNILRTNFSLRKNPSLICFLICLCTAQSTTGYIVFLLLLLCWLMTQKKWKYLLIILPIVILFVNIPFVYEKILEQIYTYQNFELSDLSYKGVNDVNRFIAFQISLDEFKLHPLFGLGGYDDGTYLSQQGYEMVISSGIGRLLAMYGVFGVLVFFSSLVMSARRVSSAFQTPNGFLLFIPILGMMFSYNMWLLPMYVVFWLFGVYSDRKYLTIYR